MRCKATWFWSTCFSIVYVVASCGVANAGMTSRSSLRHTVRMTWHIDEGTNFLRLSTLAPDHLLVHGFDIHPDALPILSQRVFGHAGFVLWRQLVRHAWFHLFQTGPCRRGVLHGR